MKISGLFFIIILTGSVACNQQNTADNNTGTARKTSNYQNNRAPLKSKPYLSLPLGAIKPKGWLREQLERMKTGLTGHLDERYSKVVGPRNGWLGGDGDGWERGPYWIDGLLPLAYLLDDDSLKAMVKPWVEWSLNNQEENGYFGPTPFEEPPEPEPGVQRGKRRDWWPKMVMLKVLKQHYSATGDERVIELMTNYFKYQLEHLPKTPLDNWSFWGNRRGADNLMVVYWLYNITGDKFLLELGELIHKQTFPWTEVFLNEECYSEKPTPWYFTRIERYPFNQKEINSLCLKQKGNFHCVNVAQGMKAPLIYYQQNPDSMYIRAVKTALKNLKKYHGQPQGMYGADEPLHGNAPTQGIEFCSVVELMYSLENMLGITGDVQFADHLEKIAYNALPTQATDDFNHRQYFQSANQVEISRKVRNFYQDEGHGGTDLCYGTLTGYPCCTSNMHQGWPKFTKNLWYGTPDNGLAALIYGPSEVTAKVANGTEVHFTEDTNYPFENTIRFKFSSEKEVQFPLHLRIPGWCREAQIQINGETWGAGKGGQIIKISRTWQDGDQAVLTLPMQIKTSRWYDFAGAVERGPLVYALKVKENWQYVENNDKYRDYKEVYPASSWNYALTENSMQNPAQGFEVVKNKNKGNYPWTIENTPIMLKTTGVKLPDWTLNDGMPTPLPWSTRSRNKSNAQHETIELIPYGATTLRITEFPVVRLR